MANNLNTVTFKRNGVAYCPFCKRDLEPQQPEGELAYCPVKTCNYNKYPLDKSCEGCDKQQSFPRQGGQPPQQPAEGELVKNKYRDVEDTPNTLNGRLENLYHVCYYEGSRDQRAFDLATMVKLPSEEEFFAMVVRLTGEATDTTRTLAQELLKLLQEPKP